MAREPRACLRSPSSYTLGGMRRIVPFLVALFGSALLLAGCSSASEGVSTVSPDEFATAMAEPGSVTIDVRTPAEYAAGHVDGAINLDVESGDFASGIAALPKDTTYNVYCRSGRRSALAADQLAESGFTSVVNLDGGLADLQSAGVPVVTG